MHVHILSGDRQVPPRLHLGIVNHYIRRCQPIRKREGTIPIDRHRAHTSNGTNIHSLPRGTNLTALQADRTKT